MQGRTFTTSGEGWEPRLLKTGGLKKGLSLCTWDLLDSPGGFREASRRIQLGRAWLSGLHVSASGRLSDSAVPCRKVCLGK